MFLAVLLAVTKLINSFILISLVRLNSIRCCDISDENIVNEIFCSIDVDPCVIELDTSALKLVDLSLFLPGLKMAASERTPKLHFPFYFSSK